MKRMKIRLVFFTIAILALFTIAASPMFQEAPGDFASLDAVLMWMLAGGAMWVFGYVEAYLLENWAKWHSFPRWVKTLVPVAFAALIGFGAQALLSLDLLAVIPAPLATLLLMMLNWLFSQMGYKGIKEGNYGSAARTAGDLGPG